MVVSKINNAINYTEQKKLNPEDIEHNATTYETEIFELDVVIAIGKEKYSFIEKEVIYFPVYFIKNDFVYSQIGLYEINSDKLVSAIDDDGDLNIDLVGDPLLYSFVTKEYLSKILSSEDIPERTPTANTQVTAKPIVDLTVDTDDEEDLSEDDPDDPDAPSKRLKSKQPTLKINKETIESLSDSTTKTDLSSEELFSKDNTVSYQPITKTNDPEEIISDKSPWIQQYMKSSHFGIQDNEGGGDCLFAVIRDAFQSIGKKTSVNKIRDILSREANDEIYTSYKQHFDMYDTTINETADIINDLTSKNKKLKKELSSSKSRKRQLEIVEEGKTILEKYNRLKGEQKLTHELKEEFEFMRGVDNLEDFKAKLKTCEFWAETWAISTLERALNIKLVLLSHESFQQGDIDNVIHCGQLNDLILEKKGTFKPDYYVLVDFNGYHYKLITYKGRKILKQPELPSKLTQLIIQKCCENDRGPYSIIEGFKTGKKTPDAISPEDVVESIHQTKYDDRTILQFYGKSSNKPYPGRGSGETIQKESMKLFGDLKKIDSWRHILSNDWEESFAFDKHNWLSVSHCIRGIQFKNNKDTENYERMSIDSGSEVSQNIEALSKESKANKGDELSSEVVEAILMSKFSQKEDLKNVLLKTHNALLMNYVKGKKPTKNHELMNVRSKLSK